MEFGAILLGAISQFGMSGLLVLIAWLFWDKVRWFAFLLLIAGAVFACVAAYGEIMPARYEVRLAPPAAQRWGGFYETGMPVEEVKAILLRNGDEVRDEQKVMGAIKIDDRELQVKDRRNDQKLAVNYYGYPQGIISYDKLTEEGWRLVSDTAVIRSVALTDRVTREGDCASVSVESAVQHEFEGWKLCLDGWVYVDEGVTVTAYKDDVRVSSHRLVRQEELCATYQREQVFAKIMHLGFKDPDKPDTTDFVTFLFFEKAESNPVRATSGIRPGGAGC